MTDSSSCNCTLQSLWFTPHYMPSNTCITALKAWSPLHFNYPKLPHAMEARLPSLSSMLSFPWSYNYPELPEPCPSLLLSSLLASMHAWSVSNPWPFVSCIQSHLQIFCNLFWLRGQAPQTCKQALIRDYSDLYYRSAIFHAVSFRLITFLFRKSHMQMSLLPVSSITAASEVNMDYLTFHLSAITNFPLSISSWFSFKEAQ